MMYRYDMTDAGSFWMVAGLIVLVAAILVGAGLIARSMRSGHGTRSTPLEILQGRFARGELSAEDYQKARQLLQ